MDFDKELHEASGSKVELIGATTDLEDLQKRVSLWRKSKNKMIGASCVTWVLAFILYVVRFKIGA